MSDRVIGHFRTLERIAIGGSAEVFRARDTRSGEMVALKVALPGNSADGVASEARLQQSLRHPNLVSVREHGVADGQAYLALELIEGPSLASVLAQGKLTPATAIYVAIGVLEALTAVHGARDGSPTAIVHRDVTPQNIMFTCDGRVKLGDFGIARAGNATRTRTGSVKGKLGYLAPEQVTQSTMDARTDLYQVGLVLFEMLCGTPYFAEQTELELLRAAESPVPKRLADHGGPEELDPVVQRALRRFPEQRYTSAASFLGELKKHAAAFGAVDLTRLTTVPRRPERRRHMTPVRLSAVAALCCTAFVIGWVKTREVEPVPAPAPLPRQVNVAPELIPQPVAPVPPVVPPKRTRATSREAAVVSTPEPVADVPVVTLVDTLEPCLQRLRGRGIATVDLPRSTLRTLNDPASDKAALCAELDAMTVDRSFVERKLSRLQAAIERLPAEDPRRPALGAVTRETLQSLLDGNVPRTNDKLHALERILAQGPQGT